MSYLQLNDNTGIPELINASNMCSGHANLSGQIHSAAINGISATYKASNDVTGNVTQHGLRNNDAIQNGLHHLASDICDTRDAVRQEGRFNERAFCDTRDTVRQEGRYIEKSLCDGFSNTNENIFRENQLIKDRLCDMEARLQREHCELQKSLLNCCAELKAGHIRIENTVIAENCKNREEALKRDLDAAQRELLRFQLSA